MTIHVPESPVNRLAAGWRAGLAGGSILAVLFIVLAAAGAGCNEKPAGLEALNTRVVTFPNGFKVRAEVMVHQTDMMRGMMFRKSLDADRGMLFIHASPGLFPYWMYQVEIPLDMIWLDRDGRIVELVPNAPPCETVASQCPSYGGTKPALMVLELQAGSIERHNLRVGMRLDL